MSFPRVLPIAMSRINAADPANNGLLLRNLLAPGREDIWHKFTAAETTAMMGSSAAITDSAHKTAG